VPRVIVATGGTAGDVLPFVPLARALAAAGLAVEFHGPAVHAHAVHGAGVAFVGLGTAAEYQAALGNADLWDARKGFGVVWRATEAAMSAFLQHLLQLPVGGPVIVLAHPLAVPVCAIAQALRSDLQVVACYLAPSNLKTQHHPLVLGPLSVPRRWPDVLRRALWWLTETFLLDPPTLPGLNGLRRRHGLLPVRHFVQHIMAAPRLTVTLFPPWFAATQSDWPTPLVSAGFLRGGSRDAVPWPEDIEAFLSRGTPPLVVTLGTGQRFAAPVFAQAIDAAQRLGRRVLLLCARDQLPAALPAHAAWAPWLPLADVLPRAAALVHHGGIGTTAEALRAGVPQLVLPRAFDQFDNAARVVALGAGLQRVHWRIRPDTLTKALRRLLSDDAIAAACQRVARQAARDEGQALHDAVRAVMALAQPSPVKSGSGLCRP